VLGAVSVATACVLPGSVPWSMARLPWQSNRLSVEHPTGEFSVDLEVTTSGGRPEVKRAALLRTARKIFDGHVFISSSVWPDAPAARAT
jgi:4-oxalomesaconate tautomerase